jgi:hypothetical protein
VIAAGAGALAIEAAEGGAIAAAGPAVAAGAAAVAGPYLAYKYVSPYTSAAAGWLTEEWYRYWYGVPGATISLANDATMQKHLQDLRNALDDLADLKEKLRNSKGKKCQDALKDAIKDLSKDIDGHVKEINQRWPNALKP